MAPRAGAAGLIVNPAAGRDIRRVVARGRFVTDEEKINITERILEGLCAAGVEHVLAMADSGGLAAAAAARHQSAMHIEMIDTPIVGREGDTVFAARAMDAQNVGCIVALGGDGTSRAVASARPDAALMAVSTGTNNVFPVLVEGTIAGLAAGTIATGAVPASEATRKVPMLTVTVDGTVQDVALVDVAAARQLHIGARAIWDPESVAELFVTGIYPTAIGLASIASRLPAAGGPGVRVAFGKGGSRVNAPITPGEFRAIDVAHWSGLGYDEPRKVCLDAGTIAVDGERSIEFRPGQAVTVTLVRNGPRIVLAERALELASRAGIFVSEGEPRR